MEEPYKATNLSRYMKAFDLTWPLLNTKSKQLKMRPGKVLAQQIFFAWLLMIIHANVSSGQPAQQSLPVIRANSKSVKIKDGLNYKPDYWVIFPETRPDIYYVDIPRKTTTVAFITDIDSISFTVQYGETKDFIVLLNGKDSCFTQISANYPKSVLPRKTNKGNDTIPFSMRDNRIYFQGRINNSTLLNIQFDLGADAANVNKKSIKKVKADFDKKGYLLNSNGNQKTRLSTVNEFELQGLKWDSIELYETKNMKKYEDIIIGNRFFLDQVYKIDYENKVLVLYHSPPELSGYSKQDMILDNGVRPVFEVSFKFDRGTYTDWFLFDTGNAGNGIVSNSFLSRNNLYGQFSHIFGFGKMKIAHIPELVVGSQTISKGVITLEKRTKKGSNYKFGGLIGNKILNSYNVIIDNRNGVLYLKPISKTNK